MSGPCRGPPAAMSADHAGKRLGPGVTMQLVDGEAVIRPDIRSWLRRFSARNLLSLLCQAIHRGEMTNSAAPSQALGAMGKKDIHERY